MSERDSARISYTWDFRPLSLLLISFSYKRLNTSLFNREIGAKSAESSGL